MRYLMDTCVFSELFKPRPEPAVLAWVKRQPYEDVFLSVVTLGEVRKGLVKLMGSERSRFLEEKLFEVRQDFEEQMLDLDEAVLLRWGWINGRSLKGRVTLPVLDSLIAATALEHGLVVATRNVKDFQRCGVDVVNPWES